jgi:hypothetical protein
MGFWSIGVLGISAEQPILASRATDLRLPIEASLFDYAHIELSDPPFLRNATRKKSCHAKPTCLITCHCSIMPYIN